MDKNKTSIDKARDMLRELQSMLFSDDITSRQIFDYTVKVDNLLNDASVDYNRYLNEKEGILK